MPTDLTDLTAAEDRAARDTATAEARDFAQQIARTCIERINAKARQQQRARSAFENHEEAMTFLAGATAATHAAHGPAHARSYAMRSFLHRVTTTNFRTVTDVAHNGLPAD